MTTAAPPLVFVALVVGALLPFLPLVGRVARIAATIAHEVGHCIVVVPFGGRIQRIDLHPDGSGEAWVQLGRLPGGIRWLVRILNLYAGYSAPLWAGVLLVTGVLHGSRWLPVAVLGVIGLVALVFVRNWFGLLVVLGFDVLALWVALRPSETTVLVVAAVGAFFVVDGLRSVVQVARWLLTGARVQTDFHIAAAEMRVPAGVWFVLFVLVNGLAVWLARVPLLEVWDTVAAGVRALF
ncbi:M50 family metallopeptidase [Curtobacterium sp. VKM Ac-1393]|uniref:M50 family metallopeptidase n=1 Tax=Curtobacterium sp. VKM Ac-1393 TaxID=2783814 RepID=UPI00188B73C4|nr:M50 family metallopeptidase [Curtobacterium sp. VKM Ac-1393]MBF4608493.1 M50 family metallopeptidase [Curtobacterium sp. VKM Ac-1393]